MCATYDWKDSFFDIWWCMLASVRDAENFRVVGSGGRMGFSWRSSNPGIFKNLKEGKEGSIIHCLGSCCVFFPSSSLFAFLPNPPSHHIQTCQKAELWCVTLLLPFLFWKFQAEWTVEGTREEPLITAAKKQAEPPDVFLLNRNHFSFSRFLGTNK